MVDSILEEFYKIRDKIIETRYSNLDISQREAILDNNKNSVVIACPGAGKTTTLIRKIDYLINFGPIYNTRYAPKGLNSEDINLLNKYLRNEISTNDRIEYLLKSKAVNPDNIIVITFTRAAAMNMKKKFKYISNNLKSYPFFGTFHGLFYKILIREYKNINIINSSKTYMLIKNVLISYIDDVGEDKIKEVINDISCYKTNQSSMDNFSPSVDKNIFIQCYKTYEEYKFKNNFLDFDDLQIKCKELFLKNKRLLFRYRKLFKYILVDEFQDCDALQIDLLKVLSKDSSVFAVGDEDQCIYGFRGSRPDCMVDFNKHFKEGKKMFLSVNYRCPSSIVKISDSLIKNNVMRNEKIIKANKSYKGKICVTNYSSEWEQAEDISTSIIKITSFKEYNYEDNAVLYRTNMESRSIIDSFIRRKIPFKLLDKQYNFFQHFICKDILSYLKLSLDSKDIESFLRIINKPFRYISKINIQKLKTNCISEDCFEKLKEMDNMTPFQMKNIDKLKKDIQNLNKLSLEGAINFVLHNLGYYEYLKEYSLKFKLNMEEFEEIVNEFVESSREYKTIITFLAHVAEVEENINSNKKAKDKKGVILSTIHGVKGMEFKNIFIINCNEDNIPHKNSLSNNLEEERRLFYVGITRTLENLWLCTCNQVRGKIKKVSRFIKQCRLNSVYEKYYKRGDKVIHKSFGKGEIYYIDNKKIEIKFENGVNRSFDSMVLYSNGLIKKLV